MFQTLVNQLIPKKYTMQTAHAITKIIDATVTLTTLETLFLMR